MPNQVDEGQILEQIKTEYNQYKITVELLSALKFLFTKMLSRKYNKFYMGREMGTVRKCVPDFVGERDDFAVVGEIKTGLPREDRLVFKDCLRQMESFDMIDSGWTNKIINTDVSLFLLNKFRVRILSLFKSATKDFKNFGISFKLDNGSEDKYNISFKNNFIFWSFSRDESESTPYFNIAKEFGNSGDRELEEMSKENIIISYNHIFVDLSLLKFFDKEPPDVYLLETLWTHVISTLFTKQMYVEKNIGGKRSLFITVTEDKLLEYVNAMFINIIDDEHGIKSIRKRVIRRFLEKLCEIDLAEEELENNKPTGNFSIKYRKIPNAIDFFSNQIMKIIKKELESRNQKKVVEFFKNK